MICLYFSKEKAGPLLHDYDGIVHKYRDIYKAEAKTRKAELG